VTICLCQMSVGIHSNLQWTPRRKEHLGDLGRSWEILGDLGSTRQSLIINRCIGANLHKQCKYVVQTCLKYLKERECSRTKVIKETTSPKSKEMCDNQVRHRRHKRSSKSSASQKFCRNPVTAVISSFWIGIFVFGLWWAWPHQCHCVAWFSLAVPFWIYRIHPNPFP
jgi:Fe2+ transport system protein B